MTILFLTRTLAAGGAERQLTLLANGLRARGHTVVVAMFYGGGILENELQEGIEVVDLQKHSRWRNWGFLVRSIRLVRRIRPDVLHGYGAGPNLLASFLSVFCARAQAVWGIRAAQIDLSGHDALPRVLHRLEPVFSRSASLIIANSTAGLLHAAAKGFPRDRLVMVNNGIDTDRFRPDVEGGRRLRSSWNVPEGAPLIGLVARLDPMKDHATFLHAAAIIRRDEPAARFVCVGRTNDRELVPLAQLSRALNIENVLTWAGERSDLAGVYSSLTVSCLTSTTEAFPNVVCEAMACGTPCVVTDVGDAAIIVEKRSQVVPSSDAEALARAVISLLSTERNKPDMDARRSIVERFSLRRLVDESERVLLTTQGRHQ